MDEPVQRFSQPTYLAWILASASVQCIQWSVIQSGKGPKTGV